MLRVRLFGGLALEGETGPLPLPRRRRGRSLLGWLALHPGMHARSEVAARFWPDVLDSSARKSLRTELVEIRQALGADAESLVVTTRDLVGLEGDGVLVDAQEFDRLIREGRLAEALEVCDGELLAGLDDEWAYDARQAHRDRMGDALERLAADAERAGSLDDAIRLSRRRVELDPLAENATRELMRRLIGSGETAAARVAFDALARRLRSELGVPPSRDTRRLIEEASDERWIAPSDARPPLPQVLMRKDSSPFVGREDALRWLRDRWSPRGDAPTRFAVIAGDPGIGKTRLATELCRAAHGEGATVLVGRCQEEALISYQPFVEAIGGYAAAVTPDVLRGQLGAGGTELARLVPGIAAALPDLPSPNFEPGEGQRYRLFEDVCALLTNASRSWPVVLLLEDLHWADRPTLLLLTHLVRSLPSGPLLVIGTYRESEPGPGLGAVLGELRRERTVEQLRLGSLHRGEVATMVEDWLGRVPPTHIVHALHRETGGNPFFIEEVLRHVVETGVLDDPAQRLTPVGAVASLGIPEGVREAIDLRMATMGPDARQVVGIAAAIGRSFSIEVLEAVGDVPADRVLDALEEATRRRIIEEEPGAPGRYTFVHALTRDAVYASFGRERRIRLHRRIGAILEERHATDEDPPLGELAYHFVHAAEPGAAAKAVEYSARAAQRALALLAYEEAADHFAGALAAMELSESPDARARCDLLLGLGEAHTKASELDRSRAAFGDAAQVARAAGLSVHLARAALGMARGWVESGTCDQEVVAALEEALDALPADETALRSRLLGRLAMELHFSGDPERCGSLAQESVALARQGDDESTVAFALNARHWAVRRQQDVRELLAWADEIVELAEGSGELELALQGHSWRLADLLELGEIGEVDEEIAACSELAERLRQPFYRSWTSGLGPMRALMLGRFEEAERLAREALVEAESAGNWNGITASRVQLAWCWKDAGAGADHVSEVREFIEGEVLSRPLSGGAEALWSANLALYFAEAGMEEAAVGRLERVSASADSDLITDVDGYSAAALAAEACALLADEQLAPRLYELLLPRDGLCIVGGRAVYFRGAAARYLGLLAATTRRWDDAVGHLEAALTTNTRAQSPPWIARNQVDLARALLARGRDEDVSRAADLLAAARTTAQELGMRTLAARAAPH